MLSKKKLIREESGQALVALALIFEVLLGMAALVIDLGYMIITKSSLQNAADSAVLAGAMSFRDRTDGEVREIVEDYLDANIDESTTYEVQVDGSMESVAVQIHKDSYKFFSGFITSNDYTISACSKGAFTGYWAGEAMPFINLDDDYESDSEIVAWEKVYPGDFESISNYIIVNPDNPEKTYFSIDYLKGITLKKGTVATVKQEVGYVYDQHIGGDTVFTLSLSSEVINSGSVMLKDGTYQPLSKLKEGDIVDPSQLVLLECIFHDYDYTGKTLYLTAQKVYYIGEGDLPPYYIIPEGGSSSLVE